MRANAAAFSDVTLWPKCLVDVSDVDISASFPELGLPRLAAPLIAAPVAMQKMAHPRASPRPRACAARRVGYRASQQATTRVETIAEALETTRLRVVGSVVGRRLSSAPDVVPALRLRGPVSDETSDRARGKSRGGGVRGDVDAPVLGRRERDVRNRSRARDETGKRDISSEKAVKVSGSSNANAVDDDDTLVNATRGPTVVRRRAIVSATTNKNDDGAFSRRKNRRRVGGRDALDGRFLEWIKSVTNRPIILKGVTRRDDAAKAVEMGVDALWVSNHGGRQLDGAPATLDALPEVVAGKECALERRREKVPSYSRRRAPRRRRLEGARAGSRPGGVREAARVGPGVRRGGRRRQSHRSITRRVKDRRGALRRSKVGRPKRILSGRRAEARGPAARSKAESPVSEST